MSQETPQEETFTIGDLLLFIKLKKTAITEALAGRTQMLEAYVRGTSAEWRKAGCKLAPKQRIKEADMHKAIASAQRREVAMYDAVIDVLSRYQP